MTRIIVAAALLQLPACTPQEEGEELPFDSTTVPTAAGEEALATWTVHLDNPSDPGGLQLILSEEGFTAHTGVAGVVWRPIDQVTGGDFTVSATFLPADPAGDGAPYSVLVGGRNIGNPDFSYSYFVVLPSGEYRIGRKAAGQDETLAAGMVQRASGSTPKTGTATPTPRTLAVDVLGEQAHFLLDGQVVETLPAPDVKPHGTAGIRLEPNVDVDVRDWTLNRRDGASASRSPS
jgi:hypothetical protein